MITILLDGAVLDRTTLHDLFSRELSFPAWYGRNLDALYDCLTDLSEDVELHLQNWESWEDARYARNLLRLFYRAAEENPHLHITMMP